MHPQKCNIHDKVKREIQTACLSGYLHTISAKTFLTWRTFYGRWHHDIWTLYVDTSANDGPNEWRNVGNELDKQTFILLEWFSISTTGDDDVGSWASGTSELILRLRMMLVGEGRDIPSIQIQRMISLDVYKPSSWYHGQYRIRNIQRQNQPHRK